MQIRHYIDTRVNAVSDVNLDFINLFKNTYNGNGTIKLISLVYTFLLNHKSSSTGTVKALWEKEAGINMSEEEWACVKDGKNLVGKP